MKTRLARLRPLPVSAIVLTLGMALASPPAARAHDGVWTNVERIVAVGDVHGDAERFILILQAAGVINETHNWIAGKTHLVQVGDVLDRGPGSKQAMELLMKLETEALAAGGRVHALIGNHEAMVTLGMLGFMRPDELAAFGGAQELAKAFSVEGRYGKWLQTHNAIIRINDLLFLHGGLSPDYARKSLAAINDEVRQALAERRQNSILTADNGPLWYRGMASRPEAALEKELDNMFKPLGVRRAVVGHTVSKDGIQVRAGGRIIMIDVGLSQYYVNGDPQCLLIEKNLFFVVTPQGKKELSFASPAPQPAE